MKKIIMLILAFTSLEFQAVANTFQEPQKVVAISGVKMRTAPSLSAKLVKIVGYGEEVHIIDTVQGIQRIEWLEGNWVKGIVDGREGYVFNGFLSRLPIPMNEYELTRRDADATYPLISWTENHFNPIAQADTVEGEDYIKEVQYFEDGIILTKKESIYSFDVVLHIPGIRVGDAYNLLRSTMLTRTERELFEENTLFIKNREDNIDKVTIDIDAPIEIIKTHDGVDILVSSFQSMCGMTGF